MVEQGPQPCRISWDSVLCEYCRDLFDTKLAGHDASQPIDPSSHQSFDWHPAGTVEACAIQSCRLCALVIDAFQSEGRSRKPSVLEMFKSANARLWGSIRARDQHDCTTFIHYKGDGSWPSPTIRFKRQKESDSGTPLTWGTATSSEQTMTKIKTWLRRCSNSHGTCSRWTNITGIQPKMPTRLLQLNQPTSSEPPNVNLLTGDDVAAARYATLSHSWGRNPPLQLVRGNLQAFALFIEWKRLPRTFQDAVMVCLALDITYLWIDSLCIVQDSSADWAQESGQMAQVYGNSYLNISAMDSSDGSDGLFRPRNPVCYSSCSFPATHHAASSGSYVAYYDKWFEFVERAPLNKRAWVVQERFLSPRVVHFCSDQVHWECADLVTSESLPCTLDRELNEEYSPKKTAFRSPAMSDMSTSKPLLLALWTKIVRSYSHARLSFQSDRPIAIAGLARVFCHFQRLDRGDYLAGLWRPCFISGLMWWSINSKLPEHLNVPSWSWLSIDGTVSLDTSPSNEGWYDIAELVEAGTMPVSDPYGAVVNGFARVRAPLCQASIKVDGDKIRSPVHLILDQATLNSKDVDFELLFDGGNAKSAFATAAAPVYILLCMVSRKAIDQEGVVESMERRNQMLYGARYLCLLILPTGSPGQFRRVGVLLVRPKSEEDALKFRTTLDAQFRKPDVAACLYEAVDQEFFYTVTLV